MPTPNDRPSLTKDLAERFSTQKAGGAFDVKSRLGNPGQRPIARMPIDGNEVHYSVDDFKTYPMMGVTELKDAIESNATTSPKSKEISRYIRGFSNQKYKP